MSPFRYAGLQAVAAAVWIFLSTAGGTQGAAETPASDAFTLDNGLKVFLVENHAMPLVHTVVGVKVGSRNETEETSGLTHILEHMILFRGSRTRSAEAVTHDIRRNGGRFNAHTGQDMSLFELTVPSGREEFALRNQADILFQLQVDQTGLDAERAVILEEMSHMEDDPLLSAQAVIYRNLFPDHPYSLPLAGTREGITRLTVEQFLAFYRSHFTPANSALAVAGDFDVADMKTKVQEIFGPLPKTETAPQPPPPAPAARLKSDTDVTLAMDVGQAYCVIGFAGPDYNHPDQYAIDLLTEILGRGVNPMLNSALRGERKLAEGASAAYQAHELGGAIIVTLTLAPRNIRPAGREALSFLRNARRLNFSPDDVFGDERLFAFDYLESARNQIRFLAEKSREKGLNLAVSLARHMLLSRGNSNVGYLEHIEGISTSDLRRAAARYFGSGKAVVVNVVPSNPERRP